MKKKKNDDVMLNNLFPSFLISWPIVLEHVFSNEGDNILDVTMFHGPPRGHSK